VSELARKTSQAVVVLRDPEAAAYTDVNPISLKRFFHGWLREVTPREIDVDGHDLGITRIFPTEEPVAIAVTSAPENANPLKRKWKILTIREILSINRATVRESAAHRHWPRDVVLKFLAADVVTGRNERP
jgi:hypothetical protein